MSEEQALNRIDETLHRIALHLEQLVELGESRTPADPYPAKLAPVDEIDDLPPVRPAPVNDADLCPIHRTPWKTVPAGTSKRTGKPYSAFQACSTAGCDQRPPR